ncbi:megakaryocyte-associated tyrosine-protein kinase isoform X1 [Falco cherrug]|uniref:megakaryocyte-associated tyrosine-protein kinase isoform X1 n=1 Tax=Falco cherrug TaxID=345164 RepID=UPI0024784A05|nr:megakaryocyte-associated tyrosine-protein kinase isoform X1 [Falco cherrug]XP_055564343.1 megakaryocyte-associated tyrosine-protein kinase isoform X1 [Falco cherrug]XP_055564344.1 megakaryocyte-associated tyrosine-protein kinase isoform X1 [Falco cherrug]XP_055564345.1 megakaryocyte-associated tyrosine-protein kinase isoform X1 [Falco cherrug]XP_055564346.1 megakaryocyte-associated tyrosine-protein kinase isoform X1 [Falco cherrug]XP_055564347.1 megakaryocyte-associated tyrosine-protein kin
MSGKHWPSGTQCVTKHDHTKPKAQELAFRKGDVVTIIEAVEGKGWYRARHNETGQEGLLAASALRERGAIRVDPKLSLMPWFHGKISGVEAVQQLQPPEDGLFLVRESVRHPGDYVLCVSFGKEVIHYRVVHKENTLSIDSQQYFSNLIDMIEHYMKEQGAICTKLVKPKPKTGMKSAEEELAKAGWLLNLQHLTLGERIGQGEFGDVLRGEYMGQKVAVKNIKCDVTAQAFLTETAAMTKVRHKNLVCLLGVILHNGLYIVMEYMSKGNLVNFLRTRGRALVPTHQLLQFALDVAQGMDYLESKKLVHRDLAARNILISEENVAKVSDFGLARVNPKGKDATLLPVKWTAPEALKHNVSSEILFQVGRVELRDPPVGNLLLRTSALPQAEPEGGDRAAGAGVPHGPPRGLPACRLCPNEELLGAGARQAAVLQETHGEAAEGTEAPDEGYLTPAWLPGPMAEGPRDHQGWGWCGKGWPVAPLCPGGDGAAAGERLSSPRAPKEEVTASLHPGMGPSCHHAAQRRVPGGPPPLTCWGGVGPHTADTVLSSG